METAASGIQFWRIFQGNTKCDPVSKGDYVWIDVAISGKELLGENILVPVKDERGGEFLVFGTVMDTTQEHELFDEVMEIMVSAQIGLYRFA